MITKQQKIEAIYENEIFVDIFNWKYQISNYWRFYICDRFVKNRHWTLSFRKWYISNYKKTKWIYPQVSITDDNWNRRMFKISRLVALWFLWLDINDNKICVCHKDDNILNNRVDNLFLWTHTDNSQDMSQKERWWSRKATKIMRFWAYAIYRSQR